MIPSQLILVPVCIPFLSLVNYTAVQRVCSWYVPCISDYLTSSDGRRHKPYGAPKEELEERLRSEDWRYVSLLFQDLRLLINFRSRYQEMGGEYFMVYVHICHRFYSVQLRNQCTETGRVLLEVMLKDYMCIHEQSGENFSKEMNNFNFYQQQGREIR